MGFGLERRELAEWRWRCADKRLDGLVDEPRPGAPRIITDEQIEAVVVATLERTPKDATHWSRASMAAECGLSTSTVGRIWRTFRLKPHQVESFTLHGSEVHRQSPRCGRAVPGSAGEGPGPLRRRQGVGTELVIHGAVQPTLTIVALALRTAAALRADPA